MHNVDLMGVPFMLPLIKINEDTRIAVFDSLSNPRMAELATKELIHKLTKEKFKFDVVLTAESKGIPFGMGVANYFNKDLVVLRKSSKPYFSKPFEVSSDTYTSKGTSKLYTDMALKSTLQGKRILVVDDVISTGSSLKAMQQVISEFEAEYAGAIAVFAEGDASLRTDILFIHSLPLFNLDGSVKNS